MQWQALGSPSDAGNGGGKELCFRENRTETHHLGSVSVITTSTVSGHDVEELEMLLELYFMQADRNLNKLTMVSSSRRKTFAFASSH